MYQRAKIGGYCHLNLGEEATCVGIGLALRPTDYLFTNYREHGYALARGIEPGRVMAELFGREDGVSRGRGGSMHLFDGEKRLMGGYAIVGGQLPPATGAALALERQGRDDAVVCQMGDGTTNIGAFHESLNLASLWKLPVVYVIVNNGYGMGTPVAGGSARADLHDKACAYDMASARGRRQRPAGDARRRPRGRRSRPRRTRSDPAEHPQLPAQRSLRGRSRSVSVARVPGSHPHRGPRGRLRAGPDGRRPARPGPPA